MRTEHVVVCRYDPEWKQRFTELKEKLGRALGDIALRIEHVGSTSVEDMAAKPIIDIDVVIKDDTALPKAVSALKEAGYFHEGDLGIKGRDAFSYIGPEKLPAHHLYVCPEDSDELARHIAFRNWLRSHPDEAKVYSDIKERGARMYPYNIDGYIEYKSSFIADVYAEIESDASYGSAIVSEVAECTPDNNEKEI